ncbi:DUF397 domain-containing protein [Streptomyces ziwulingensis]|uniref:DUF397 domain-containing protein n=1 Tax=Streptomyces ziwulingensis TaxID=1045501 RepID=A0ABP9D2X7_9ACTN
MPARYPVPCAPRWFKSSYSGANATECVEAAFVPSGVLIRDSKRPEGAQVTISARAWEPFVTAHRVR